MYLSPKRAWEFVEAREKVEGRKILPKHFIDQYFDARETVDELKKKFGKDISVDLLLKETDGSQKLYKAGVDQIGNHIPEKYTRADIEKFIGIE